MRFWFIDYLNFAFLILCLSIPSYSLLFPCATISKLKVTSLVYDSRHDNICLYKRSYLSSRFWRNNHLKRRSKSENEEEEDGKFLQLGSEITKPFGPLGLIVAGYNQEEYLDLIIDACERTLNSKQTLPVAILGKSDLSKTFLDITSELDSRDCTLPADGDELNLRYPLLLYSGFEIPQLQVCYKRDDPFTHLRTCILLTQPILFV